MAPDRAGSGHSNEKSYSIDDQAELMPYTFNTPEDIRAMLAAIGASSLDDLFEQIPQSMRLARPLDCRLRLCELELTQHLQALAAKNSGPSNKVCFLGGGSYDHFVPAVVDAIASRGEFYTSYTPYQPEVSQGNLQAMFEYQTMICQLTGMDVSNASLYDGGSAAAEAVLLAMSVTKRPEKAVAAAQRASGISRRSLKRILPSLDAQLVTVDCPRGVSTRRGLGRPRSIRNGVRA